MGDSESSDSKKLGAILGTVLAVVAVVTIIFEGGERYNEIKRDIATNKTDIKAVKTDVTAVKASVSKVNDEKTGCYARARSHTEAVKDEIDQVLTHDLNLMMALNRSILNLRTEVRAGDNDRSYISAIGNSMRRPATAKATDGTDAAPVRQPMPSNREIVAETRKNADLAIDENFDALQKRIEARRPKNLKLDY